MKIEFYINKPAQESCAYLFENYNRLYAESNTAIKNELVHNFGENAYVYREILTPPLAVIKPRDVTIYQMKIATEEGMHAIIGTSVEGAVPEDPANYIRAENKYQIHLFEPTTEDANRTHVTVSFLGDPKGSIPSMVVNKMSQKRIKFYAKLKESMDGR
jgi:hypothetical protein